MPSLRFARTFARIAVLAVAALALLTGAATAQAAPVARGIWITHDQLLALPTSGSAWTKLKSAADGSLGTPNIADQDSDHDVRTLAVALVYARTNDPGYRAKAAAAIMSAVGTEAGGRTLALARNLAAYVIAADLVNLREYDPAQEQRFRSWLASVRTRTMSDGRSLTETHERRANNWGTNAGASRIAAAVYLGDVSDLGRAASVFRGWLGDRSAYAGFKFGSLSWQADPEHPVGINKKGATINGHTVDGVLPDDQRRAGGFSWPPPTENYVWGGLGPAYVAAELLFRAGYADAYDWSDSALFRAMRWLHEIADFPATGDDTWVPWLANHAYGTSFPASSASLGKPMAWTDWTHAGTSGTPGTPSLEPAPAEETAPPVESASPRPEPTPEPAPEPAAPSSGAQLAFVTTGDALVNAGNASKNYGSLDRLRVKSGQYMTYLRFEVSGLSGAPKTAKLRLYVDNRSDDGGSIYLTSAAWAESSISWSTAPGVGGSPIARIDAPTSGVWIEVDLGSAIAGNGTYSLAIVNSSSNSAYYSSREGANAPVLVLAA